MLWLLRLIDPRQLDTKRHDNCILMYLDLSMLRLRHWRRSQSALAEKIDRPADRDLNARCERFTVGNKASPILEASVHRVRLLSWPSSAALALIADVPLFLRLAI